MRAISIRAPWTWAILRAGKRIENRSWPGLDLMRLPQAIVLHTSATPDHDSWAAVERASGVRPPPVADHWTGHINGLATVRGAVSDVDQVERMGQIEWWAGPSAILLGEALQLERPIQCGGALGLWSLAPRELGLLTQQLVAMSQSAWLVSLSEEGDYIHAGTASMKKPLPGEPDRTTSCVVKRRYATLSYATGAKARAERERPETPLRTYPCEFCHGFHLTSMQAP